MKSPILLATFALAWSAAANLAFAQDPQAPAETLHTRTHATWIRPPITQELTWPGYAFMAHMNGHVVLDCAINDKNKLKPCTVVEETPAGQGFANAALAELEPTKMKPPTIDGAPVPDAHVQLTFDFHGRDGGIQFMWRSQ